MSDKQLLQRAWDALAIWKETYPEGWDDDDERLLGDLLTRIAEPQREWVNLTDDEIRIAWGPYFSRNVEVARVIEAKLKEKNT